MASSLALDISLENPSRPTLPDVPGFGDYLLPEGKTFDQMQLAASVQKIALEILFGVLAISSIFLFPISAPLAIVLTVGFTLLMIQKMVEVMAISNRAPPLVNLFSAERIDSVPRNGELSEVPCSGFSTQDGPDSQKWKEELICSAQHSIVLSGCYCGGKTFDRTLDLIRQRLSQVPALNVYLLSSDVMIEADNRTLIATLQREFPDRFHCLITPEIFPLISPTTNRFSLTTNHTKALVVDYGTYFMIGGSGIVSSWAEQTGEQLPTNLEPKPSRLGRLADSLFKMRAYRDMDFVFRSETTGAGARLHIEMMKLFERMRYQGGAEMQIPNSNWPTQIHHSSQKFAENETLCNGLKVACYPSGPEQKENAFLEEMIAQVNGATESIVIDHLYFHPPKRLLAALIAASNRGVKITILTNKNGPSSPGLHLFYAQRSSYFSRKVFEGRVKENVELYEFSVPHTTLHKKVILIDGKTALLGSTNLGKKCLENMDYEINLKVESAEFAAQIQESIEADKLLCERILDEKAPQISYKIHLFSSAQSLLTNFV